MHFLPVTFKLQTLALETVSKKPYERSEVAYLGTDDGYPSPHLPVEECERQLESHKTKLTGVGWTDCRPWHLYPCCRP